jgi:transposase-like protein
MLQTLMETSDNAARGTEEAREPVEADLTARRGERATRRRLTGDEQVQIAQQYADGGLPAADIAREFGISEVSVYRTLRTQGVALRGRTPSASIGTRGKRAAGAAPTWRVALNSTSSANRSRPADGATRTGGATRTQYQIQFRGEQIVHAANIRDVLRQLESLGTADVLEITQAQ